MTDDVIKRPERVIDIEDAHVPQLDVGEPERLNRLLPLGDLLAGEVNAHELAVRESERHGDQVAATGAAQLEHAAAFGRWRAQAEQARHRGQVVGVGIGVGMARVGNLVVSSADSEVSHRRHGFPAGLMSMT